MCTPVLYEFKDAGCPLRLSPPHKRRNKISRRCVWRALDSTLVMVQIPFDRWWIRDWAVHHFQYTMCNTTGKAERQGEVWVVSVLIILPGFRHLGKNLDADSSIMTNALGRKGEFEIAWWTTISVLLNREECFRKQVFWLNMSINLLFLWL